MHSRPPSLNVIISANARFHFCCTFPFMTFDHNDHSTNNSRTHGMINKCFYSFVEDTEGNTLSKSELPSSTGSRDIDLRSCRLELCSAARRATLLGLRRANEQSDRHETRDPGRGHQGRARVQIWASYDEGKPRYRGRKLRYEFYTFRRWR